jgi:hypothetical protein
MLTSKQGFLWLSQENLTKPSQDCFTNSFLSQKHQWLIEIMKKGFATTIILLFLICPLLDFASANPSFPSNTPPIVSVSNMEVNVNVSSVHSQLWATVDIKYKTDTIHGFGDSYTLPLPKEYFPPTDGIHYSTIRVVSNMLEAHYPYPLNAKNLTVKINDEEKDWQIDNRGYCHIFDSNLKEINWTIEPVPKTFDATVHYEQPIPKISDSQQYLGQYALVLPLIPRYGSTNPPYPLYSWFSYRSTTASFSIQVDQSVNQVNAYSIDNQGTLTQINPSGNIGSKIELQIINSNDQTSFPYGALLVANIEPPTQSYNLISYIAASCVIILTVGVSTVLLLHIRHRRQVKKV